MNIKKIDYISEHIVDCRSQISRIENDLVAVNDVLIDILDKLENLKDDGRGKNRNGS